VVMETFALARPLLLLRLLLLRRFWSSGFG
jgi:hypothetical protein